MTFTIALAGKGGTGKTSTASLIIRYLVKRNSRPILAVDADPNANLGESLGLKVGQTIGSIIAQFNEEKINIPSGLTKEAYLTFKLNETIVESRGIDLITMGRGEGDDCYCYPNLILRKFIDNLTGNYGYIVMDNEAGLEHLSRKTTQNVDTLLIVSDHSVKGARTIARVKALVKELQLDVKKELNIINAVPGGKLDRSIIEEMDKLGIAADSIIPYDEIVYQADLNLKSLLDLPETSGAVKAISQLMAKILPE